MKTSLSKGLNDKDREELELNFAHSSLVRKTVAKVLLEKIDTNNKVTRTKDAYGISNWAFLQADAVGYERALREVISLLDAAEDETPPATQKRTRGRPRKLPTS